MNHMAGRKKHSAEDVVPGSPPTADHVVVLIGVGRAGAVHRHQQLSGGHVLQRREHQPADTQDQHRECGGGEGLPVQPGRVNKLAQVTNPPGWSNCVPRQSCGGDRPSAPRRPALQP